MNQTMPSDESRRAYAADLPLLIGCVLDGRGAARPIAWDQAQTWQPAAEGEVLWIHLLRTHPGVQEWLEANLGIPEPSAELLTSDETLAAVTAFAEDQLGKTTIRSKDRAGFIVNALLIPYLLSAIRMMESGFASAEDIDAGMVQGCAHPQGPLALADLIGLDTTAAVAQSMYEEFKEPLYAPPPLLARMVDAGLLGKKAGRGFYDYS